MANENQGQGRKNDGRGRSTNGGAGRDQGQGQSPEPQAPPGVEQVTNRLHEGYESARDEVSRRFRQTEDAVSHNPGSSVLIGFGLGFGIGLALTIALTSREETWAERYLPDSLRDLPDTLRNARVPESVRGASSNVHGTFHHLAESIRDLPSAIARAMPGR